MGLLTQTAEAAREVLEVETIDVVADRGYFKIEDIEACEKAGMTPCVPRPQRGPAVREGFFRKDEFRYDAEKDAYICPAGQTLATRYESKLRDLKKFDYSSKAACLACPLKSRCTNNYRKVSRLENEAVMDRMAERLKARPEILNTRREIVEHPFGSIKQWMNQGAFLMRGLDKVRAEFSLTALVYNLRRALNILGVEALMKAVGSLARNGRMGPPARACALSRSGKPGSRSCARRWTRRSLLAAKRPTPSLTQTSRPAARNCGAWVLAREDLVLRDGPSGLVGMRSSWRERAIFTLKTIQRPSS